MNESAAVSGKSPRTYRLDTVVRWLALAAIPASLFSPGATVAMALVALFGLFGMLREGQIPTDISRVGRITVIFYLAVLIADFANGGGLVNLQSTGFNYLHLVAVAPFALALRQTGLDHRAIDRAMQVTVLLAFASAVVQYFFFSVIRPGGLFLNPIPYGFVVALWGVFLLSRGLELGRDGAFSIAVAAAAFVPVLITESKIAWACMIVGYSVVAAWWAFEHRRWKTIVGTAAIAAPLSYAVFQLFAYRRMEPFLDELRIFFVDGIVSAQSFGLRYELATSGLRAFAEKPALGFGLSEHMSAVFAHADANGPDITILSHMHNDYITHMVSFGVIGLAFIVGFLAFAGWLAQRCSDAGTRRAGFTMVAMLALYMCFDIAFNMDPISGPVTVVFGILLLNAGRERTPRQGVDPL